MVGALYHRDEGDKGDKMAGLVFPTEFVEATVDSAYLELREYLLREHVNPMVLELVDNVVYGMVLQRYFPVERQWNQGVTSYNREVAETLGRMAWGVKRLQGSFFDGTGMMLTRDDCEVPLVEVIKE